jgi:hypothetical protein
LRAIAESGREQHHFPEAAIEQSKNAIDTGPGKNGKPRDRYDAIDIAHLERVVRAAEDAADAHPDDDFFNSIRAAIQNKPEGIPGVGTDFENLAMEAFEIVFNDLGDQLMASTGKS